MKYIFKKNKGFEIDNPIQMEAQQDSLSLETQEQSSFSAKNRFFAFFIISLLLVILFGRTFYLQVVRGAYYRDVSENNRIREVVIRAPRGIIFDRHGEVLARNIPSFDVVFVPAQLPKSDGERQILVESLSVLIGQDRDEVRQKIDQPSPNDKNIFLLKEYISEEVAYEMIEKSYLFGGIYVGNTAKRDYQDGKNFSCIIGYDGKITQKELEKNQGYLMIDNIGKDGLEYSYEEYLRGVHGAHRYEVDSNGNIKEDLGVINPVKGDDLILSVDAQLQSKIVEILEKIVEENEKATGASAVAIDPSNGEVRALVSVPGYENNMFARGITTQEYQDLLSNPNRPLLNRAISGAYPPGSTFKVFVAAAALEEGIISENTVINCPGVISVGSWSFPDWKTHGSTDVKKAIAESCNVFFYAVAGGWQNISALNITRIEQYGKIFGFGEVAGIDLPGEIGGNLPSENWKFKTFGEKWYVGDSYHAGIGQGFVTTTPLQLANMTAAIANGGTLYRPRIVNEIVDARTGKGRKFVPEVIFGQVASGETMRIVREGMRQTVSGPNGSGRSLANLEVATAGKTGTAQFGGEDKTHSWYVSFGPYENPELAMVVLVEGGGEGHELAVPATREIYEWYFDQERGTVNLDQEDDVNEEESSGTGEDASASESR